MRAKIRKRDVLIPAHVHAAIHTVKSAKSSCAKRILLRQLKELSVVLQNGNASESVTHSIRRVPAIFQALSTVKDYVRQRLTNAMINVHGKLWDAEAELPGASESEKNAV